MTALPDDYEIPQSVLDLYDEYAHGGIDRRTFMSRLSAYATAAVSVSALAACMTPDYSEASSRF